MGDNSGLRFDRMARGALAAALLALLATTVSFMPTPASAAAADAAVPCNIVTGADRPSQQVARLYKAVFRRPPEPEGWNYWKGVIATTSLFDIAAYFVEAAEFVNLYGSATNDEFVRLIYLNVMGREPDPEGYQYWRGVLNRGELTRADMVVYFSESSEFKRRENNLYTERCPQAVSSNPSAIWANTFQIYLHSIYYDGEPLPRHETELWIDLVATSDRADGSTTYGVRWPSGQGDPYLARRSVDEPCVEWRLVDPLAVGTAWSGSRLAPASLLPGIEGLSTFDTSGPLFDPSMVRQRVSDYGAAVDAVTDYVADTCEEESTLLTALAQSRYELLPNVSFQHVWSDKGFVRRTTTLGTEELRRLSEAEEPSLADIATTLEEDLEVVDGSNAALRRAGYGHLANDRLVLDIMVWEDLTGNLVASRTTYRVYVTQADLSVYVWEDDQGFRRS